MAAKKNPSGASVVLLLAGAGVAYYYWSRKKKQQQLAGEAMLGLQLMSEAGPMSSSVTGLRDAAQAETDAGTAARFEAEQQALMDAQAAAPQTTNEMIMDAVFPGIAPEIR